VRVFVDERRERRRRRETLQEPNPATTRRTQRTVEVIDQFKRNPVFENPGRQRRRFETGVA
jgi:hypothetical protein